MEKKVTRKRRGLRTRCKIKELNMTRLCINRTLKHIYAQIIINDSNGDKVLASASTLDKEVIDSGVNLGNLKGAKAVGSVIAKRALAQGIKQVAFDRSGFKYHGTIRVLAEAARENGLEF